MVNSLSHAVFAAAVGCLVTTTFHGRPDFGVGLVAGLMAAIAFSARDALAQLAKSRHRTIGAAILILGVCALFVPLLPASFALSVAVAAMSVAGLRVFRWMASRRTPAQDVPVGDPLLNAYVSLPSIAALVSLAVLAPV